MLKLNIKNNETGKRHLKLSTIFFIFSVGSLIHLILDAVFSGMIIPFYPISSLAIGLNLISLFPKELEWMIPHTIDAILLFFWIFWMEFKLKISNYF